MGTALEISHDPLLCAHVETEQQDLLTALQDISLSQLHCLNTEIELNDPIFKRKKEKERKKESLLNLTISLDPSVNLTLEK